MPKPPPPQFQAYMRFLGLTAPFKTGKDALSAHELALFEEIAVAWAQSTPLSVSQAIGIQRLGVSTTVFKRLAALRQRKLIAVVKAGNDSRTKLLALTPKGMEYLQRFADAMAQSHLAHEGVPQTVAVQAAADAAQRA